MTARFRSYAFGDRERSSYEVAIYQGQQTDIEPAERDSSPASSLATYDLLCHCVTQGFEVVHRPDRVTIVGWREANVRRHMLFPAGTSLSAIRQWTDECYTRLHGLRKSAA